MTALLERPPRTAPTIVFGPNWFASVMGTGILATAAAALPVHVPGLRILATLGWALAAALLAVLVVAAVRHARTYADDPVLSQFWGAPPMALMTVGAGTLLVGRDWLGEPVAVAVDLVLWTVGTVLGLAVAVAVPYRMMTRHRAGPDAAFGGWLMPVVSPMVSAAGGALLVPHVAARAELLLACYAMFGVSLFAAILVIGQIWGRLMLHGAGPARLVPTLWIVLGPLGQSVTAAHLLGRAAQGVLPEPYANGAQLAAVLYGVPTLGFALFWAALAGAITARTARAGLPFSLTWWSFTFPVGTVATGASGLAVRTGSVLLTALAVLLYAGLVAAWAVVAIRTLRGLARGDLLQPAPPAIGSEQARVEQ
ncbi:TDT family transporter [Amorphoplanes digitatis]|uniref:C4-dicarboxylate transporter/malic acid transport protein n=1 Tax=Actinoplanes digitatis TaxID=1868 RepID=A0A7W7MQG5_9ACTN|nr:TDT family transporter [Actinoplanes digitatis]MBB4762379.1 C4-dicarboxylate transporter/malic acid transport protein [Actinoplanes digitatis]GID92499.1 C4-dicarboxylate ABC transporter [Actinoplanes digitatis]